MPVGRGADDAPRVRGEGGAVIVPVVDEVLVVAGQPRVRAELRPKPVAPVHCRMEHAGTSRQDTPPTEPSPTENTP